MLRCKFRLESVSPSTSPGTEGRNLHFYATNEKDGDNQDWSKFTPSGSLTFFVTNPEAFPRIDAMRPGEFYYIDVSPVAGMPAAPEPEQT